MNAAAAGPEECIVNDSASAPMCHQYALLVVCVSCCALLLTVCGSGYIFSFLFHMQGWFEAHKVAGVLAFCVLFAFATAALLPYTPFCIFAGYMWGLQLGFGVQTCAITVSVFVMYLLAHTCFRARALAHIDSHFAFWKIVIDKLGSDSIVASKLNLLLCFVPMPYGIHVYLFALSNCGISIFLLGFQVGMILHTYLNLSIGATLRLPGDADNQEKTGLWYPVLLLCSIVSLYGIVCYVRSIVRDIVEQQAT